MQTVLRNIPEQIALLFDLTADLGKAPLDLDRLIVAQEQQHSDTLGQQSGGIFIRNQRSLAPHGFKRVPHHQLIAVLILRGIGYIRLDHHGKITALWKSAARTPPRPGQR